MKPFGPAVLHLQYIIFFSSGMSSLSVHCRVVVALYKASSSGDGHLSCIHPEEICVERWPGWSLCLMGGTPGTATCAGAVDPRCGVHYCALAVWVPCLQQLLRRLSAVAPFLLLSKACREMHAATPSWNCNGRC